MEKEYRLKSYKEGVNRIRSMVQDIKKYSESVISRNDGVITIRGIIVSLVKMMKKFLKLNVKRYIKCLLKVKRKLKKHKIKDSASFDFT